MKLKEIPPDRRTHIDRRQFTYSCHLPERRIIKDRRTAKNKTDKLQENGTDMPNEPYFRLA